MEEFFSDDDLLDILKELDEVDAEVDELVQSQDEEMEASSRRYEEIIKKHKM